MFCPNCSQSQVSDEIRFCSRCGFPLSVVAELISNDGILPTSDSKSSYIKRRKIILRCWAVLSGISLVLAPFIVIGLKSVEAIVIYLFFSIVLLLSGFAWLIHTRLSKEDREILKSAKANMPNLSEADTIALPPIRSLSSDSVFQAQQTNQLISRGSVTERTTKLFEQD